MKKYFIEKFISRGSSRVWFAILSFTAIFFWVSYIRWIDVGIILSDQFPWLIEYDKVRNGNLSWSDLWVAKGGHRLPGYKILFYLNAWLFDFSPFIEILSAIIPFSLLATYLSFKLSERLPVEGYIKILVILTFLFLFLNAQVFRLSNYSLIATQLFDYTGFVIVVFMSYRLAIKPGSGSLMEWVAYVSMVIIVILGFGRGYGVAASASIFCMSLMWALHLKNVKFLYISVIVFLTIPVYLIGITSDGAGASHKFDFLAFNKYIVLKLGNAYTGMIYSDGSEIWQVTFPTGIAILLLKLFIIFKCITNTKVDKVGFIALFFILMSLFSLVLVSISRYDQSPYYPRHNLEVSLGAIGVLYFVLNFVFDRLISIKSKTGAAIVVSILLVSLIANHLNNLGSSVFVKNYYRNLEKSQSKAYSADSPLAKKEYHDLQCRMSSQQCFEVFQLMKLYGISRERLETK